MSYFAFLAKTLWVSMSVGLRMIPVLGITFYSLYMLFLFFGSSELAIYLIGIVIYMPLLMFLYLCSVRAGLAALKATTAPSFGKLFKGSIRLMRFHFMISNLVMMVVGLGGMGFVIYKYNPMLIEVLTTHENRSMLLDINIMINEFSNIPIMVLFFPPLAISIAVGLVGASLGATAAWVAERGPQHDLIWGITSKFTPLFITAALVLVGPVGAIVALIGGPLDSVWNILFLSPTVRLAYFGFSMWAICVVAAAMALAYVITLKELEENKRKEEAEMMGTPLDPGDVRDLRLARQAQKELVAAE